MTGPCLVTHLCWCGQVKVSPLQVGWELAGCIFIPVARSFCLLLALFILFAIVCLFCWGCTVSERRTMFVFIFFLLLLTTVILFSAFSLWDGWRQSKQMTFLQRFSYLAMLSSFPWAWHYSLGIMRKVSGFFSIPEGVFPLFINIKKLAKCKNF